jgi:uncharacterized protein YfaS (alpha-2-macroglobulin family)
VSNVRRLSLVLAISLLLNVALTTLWLRARRAAILPSIAKVSVEERPRTPLSLDIQFVTDMPTERTESGLPPLVFDPPLEGEPSYTWRTPRLLAVYFDKVSLIPGKTYQVRPDKELRDGRGLPLDTRAQTFVSPDLKLLDPVEIQRVSETQSQVTLSFNGLVFPESVARQTTLLYLWQGKSMVVEAEAKQAEYTHRVVLTLTHPAELTKATLRIRPGLKAKDADSGTNDEIVRQIDLVPSLRITRVWCPERESGQLTIRFSTTATMNEEDLKGKIEVSPSATFRIERGWRDMRLVGNFKPRTFYRVVFRKGITGILSTRLTEDTSFTVVTGRLRPDLDFLSNGPILPRSRKAELLVRMTGVEKATFSAWRVYPRNYVDYFRDGWDSYYRSRHERYGTHVRSVDFEPKLAAGEKEVRKVPLNKLLQGENTGLFVIEADGGGYGARDRRRVVLTDIGLGSVEDQGSVLVWALSLTDGTPLENCEISLFTDKNQVLGTARTGTNGTALISYGELPDDEKPYLVTARRGDDLSMLLLTADHAHNQVPFELRGRPYPSHAYEAFAYTERGICRPGERVVVSTFVRDDAHLQAAADLPVELRVRDPLGRVLQRIPRVLNGDGFATARFEIPFDARTGNYTVQVAMPGGGPIWGSTRFTVGCYRPDQIRATLTLDKPVYQLPNADIRSTLDGHFYFGPPASDCKAYFRWELNQTPFRPKGYEDYVFGDGGRRDASYSGGHKTLKTDADGRAALVFNADPDRLPQAAWSLAVTAEITAPSGVTVSAHAGATLHPYPFYLGLRQLWEPGQAPQSGVLPFGWVAVSPDGKEVAPDAPVYCELRRHEYSSVLRQRGNRFVREWIERWVRVAEGEVPNGKTATAGDFTVPCPQSGSYRLTVRTRDEVQSSMTFWYSAGDAEFARPASPDALEIETDQPSYRPGDTATIQFSSPAAGQALVCLSGNHVIHTEAVPVQAGVNSVALPIPATMPYASLFVSATVVCAQPDGHDATRRLFGLGRITVNQAEHRLDVALDAPEVARPNGDLPVTVRLRAGETPVGGTVQLLAVDEGVLALTGYRTPDPFGHFFGPRSCSLDFADVYDRIFPDLSKQFGDASLIGGDGALTDFFNPAAPRKVKNAIVLARLLHVDETGEANVTLQLPDHTGALRLMAIAANPDQVGAAHREVKVHHPLAVQLSLPRAVAPGDQFQGTVSVFNTELPETDIEVRLRAEGTLQLTGEKTMRFRLARNKRQVLRIPVQTVTDRAGQGTLYLELVGGGYQLTTQAELTCRPASPPIYRSSFLVVAKDKPQTFTPGADMLPGTGDCQLQVSADPVIELAPALSWLLAYEYGCLEQTTSRAMPLVALRNLSSSLFLPQGTDPNEGAEWRVREALLRLSSMEQPYGGFGSWPGSGKVWVGGSLYACHFLHEARLAGYPVDPDLLRRAGIFLRRLVEEFHRYPESTVRERAYAIYLLAAMGEPEPGVARGLAEDAKSPSFARFLAAVAMVRGGQAGPGAAILKKILATDYLAAADYDYFDTRTRRTALALDVLADAMPDSPECLRLVKLLRSQRNAEGHWGTTQNNAMALLAMSRWLRSQGGQTGQGTVRIGDKLVKVEPGSPFHASFQKTGQTAEVNATDGTLYVSWQQRGVPLHPPTEDVAETLHFVRHYYAEDGTETTTFAQGDLVRVRLEFTSGSSIDRLVLADVLPGGFEIEDSSLATRSAKATKQVGFWADAVEKRDDRLVLSGHLYYNRTEDDPGIYEYHVRAVTPGTFAIPRLVAENMYDPTQRAETGQGTLTIRPVP